MLDTGTWYYAKRCFIAMAENMAKHMPMLKCASMRAAKIPTAIAPSVVVDGAAAEATPTRTLAFEARKTEKPLLKPRVQGLFAFC